MIRRTLAALALTLVVASPAAACDPFWDDCWWWWEEPAWQEPAWEPAPVVADAWWWQEPAWAPAPQPAPAPEPVWQAAQEPAPAVPHGVYLVTEVYVVDVVSVAGPLTTYSTATVADTPGTYARVIDTVGTGTVSPYDGSAFNGRTALDDGRSVAGTYYENFVLTNGEFVPVSVVFFQDDSALAAASQPTPAPTPPPTLTPPATPSAAAQPTPGPVAPTPVPVSVTPTPSPASASAPPAIARIDPLVEPPLPAAPALEPSTVPRLPVVRPGISLSPVGALRAQIEVLRGRSIPLWIRAVSEGVAHPVAGWRIRPGQHVALGPAAGGDGDVFNARWDVVTPPGTAWILGVDVTVVVGGIPQVSLGEIAVVVRSPALVR